MSARDEGDDIGALLREGGGGPPPDVDARVLAYARERVAADAAAVPDGRSGRPAAAGRWRRALPAVAVVALVAVLAPLVRDEAPGIRESAPDGTTAGASGAAKTSDRPESAELVADDADDSEPEAVASSAPAPAPPTADRARATAPPATAPAAAPPPEALAEAEPASVARADAIESEVAPEPVAESRAASAGFAASSDALSSRRAPDVEVPFPEGAPPAVSARAVVDLLRGGAPDERVAEVLRVWAERWPGVSFEDVSGASAAELEALRRLAPGALPTVR